MTEFTVVLPGSLAAAVARSAESEGVTPAEWIAFAAAQKVGAVDEVAVFFRARAGQARPGSLLTSLQAVPDAPPVPGDELPADLRATIEASRL